MPLSHSFLFVTVANWVGQNSSRGAFKQFYIISGNIFHDAPELLLSVRVNLIKLC